METRWAGMILEGKIRDGQTIDVDFNADAEQMTFKPRAGASTPQPAGAR